MDWEGQYETERERLVEALRKVTDGGIIESIQHSGATSMSDSQGSSCVDIGMSVWPFPLESSPRSKLEAMGYQILEGFTESPQQRFRHASENIQLSIFEAGAKEWFDFTLISDYLRHNRDARDRISEGKSDEIFAELIPDVYRWWIAHYGFSPVEEVAKELKEAPFEWYVSGGWALDLFLGWVERPHHDVDLVMPRRSQLELQSYLTERGWKLITPFQNRLEPWPLHMRLELPRHQVHAHRDDHFMEFLFTDMDDVWRYRREPSILRAKERMSLKSQSGIPYLAPELVLLFKSRNTSNQERPKDQTDFEKTFPHLEPERRAWLYWALMATSPDHPWINQLVP